MFTAKATGRDSGRDAARLCDGQVGLLYRQLPSALLAAVIIAILLVSGLWALIPRWQSILWLFSIFVLSWVRYRWLRRYRASHPAPADTPVWARRFVIGVVLHGLIWGVAGVCFFVPQSYVHQTLLAFALAGLSAGSVSTLSPLRGAYPAFLLPALLPYAVRVLVVGNPVHLIMGVMVLLFVIMMWAISGRLNLTVTESLSLQFSNLDLIDDLTRERDRQNLTHRELAAEVEARHEAQGALQRSYEELEDRVRERTQELAQSNERLATEKELFRITLASITDGVITVDSNQKITYLNPAAESHTGWTNSEAQGAPLAQVFQVVDKSTKGADADSAAERLSEQDDARPDRRVVLIGRNGREQHIDHSKAPICDARGNAVGTVLTFRDVTAELKLEQQLSHQANHDPLTGLVNRREFERRLARALQLAQPGDPHALIYIDLDQFKVVNDTCGHVAGDELLRQIAALMRLRIRARDTFARLGGDEFGILLEHCSDNEALQIAQTIRELAQKFRFGWQDRSFTVTMSIGIVSISDVWESSTSILRAADSACYAAKDLGRNRVCVYEPTDRAATRHSGEIQWISRIHQALVEGRLCLYLQPILPTSSRGQDDELGEVLLRLLDDQGLVVLPDAYLPAAERYGQMNMIDRWVVDRTFAALNSESRDRLHNIICINLSRQSLNDDNFLDFVAERIKANHTIAPRLCFEVAETDAISDFTRVKAFIKEVKELGCRFSLDDSGLSAFSFLKELGADYVKIDGRFVKEILSDPFHLAMVEAIHQLGHVLGLRSIAQWVEDAATLEKLVAMNVDYAQGFHIAPPGPMWTRTP